MFDDFDLEIQCEEYYTEEDDCHATCKNNEYLCSECHRIFNDCYESKN